MCYLYSFSEDMPNKNCTHVAKNGTKLQLILDICKKNCIFAQILLIFFEKSAKYG